MSTTKCAWSCALVLLATTASTSAGPLTGVNLLVNGEFESDPPGTEIPTAWALETSAPAGWQGVTQYGSTNGHPKQRPDGQGSPYNCYGTFMAWQDTSYGVIEQVVNVGTPGEGPVEGWIGGWVYTGDLGGAYVQFALEQSASKTLWESPQIYDVGDGNGWWTSRDYTISSDYGFVAGPITFRATIQLAPQGPPQVGIHGMFTDGLELEAQVIPEPGAIVLLVVAGLGWLGVRRHRDG